MTLTDGRLNENQLKYVSDQIKAYQATYKDLRDYYMGRNAAIYQPAHIDDPDNRIPVPIARKMVSTVKGYAYRPGYISYDSKSSFVQNKLKPVFDDNDEELLTGELANDMLTFGVGFEVIRVGMDGRTPKLYRIPVNTGWPVYSDTLEKTLIAFVHEVEIQPEEVGKLESTWVRTIYYPDQFEVYNSTDRQTWKLDKITKHKAGVTPVVIYRGNSEEMSLFRAVIPMIDELDKVLSGNADERERFANAFLLSLLRIDTTTEDDNGETPWDILKRSGILQNLGRNGDITNVNDAIGFLTKPSRGTEVSEDANRLERLIYEMTQVINPNDDQFNSTSGIALKYKLLTMEWLCADIDGYFDKGLQTRISILQNLIGGQGEMVTINHKRNIPTDILDMANAANEMLGQPISDEDILRIAYDRSIIPEPAQTVEKYNNQGTGLPGINDGQNTDNSATVN